MVPEQVAINLREKLPGDTPAHWSCPKIKVVVQTPPRSNKFRTAQWGRLDVPQRHQIGIFGCGQTHLSACGGDVPL